MNLHGLIQLVNGSTKPESQPFKARVSEVIVTIQRDGTYSLDPAPLQTTPGTSYVMPPQVADAIVRLEERNLRADEALAAAQAEHLAELRRANEERSRVSEQLGTLTHRVTGVQDVLTRIADALDQIVDRMRPAPTPQHPPLTPQHLLATWRDRNLVVTEDMHAVAAHLAFALVHGPVACRLEDVAARTGRTLARVHDCVRMLIKRGGCTADRQRGGRRARLHAPVAHKTEPEVALRGCGFGLFTYRTRPHRRAGDVGGISYPHE
ncbi:DNA-binding protein [Streptomyces sp. NRRL F-2799]|uniref:DNA-binding protein n=1 Tax=Streptomyces sp. NRRL F-2799 TaxID=1463844 RepID=UPI000ADC8534|nr:DNA-binding protein [Streptomyces sp. NRRL F-2799]